MNAWPAALPQRAQVQGYSRSLADARLSSPMEAGPAKMRRRLSFMPEPLAVSMVMSTAQREAFEAFVKDTIKGGTLPFTFPAQDTATPGTWIVQIGQGMPSWTQFAPGQWQVSIDLVRLP